VHYFKTSIQLTILNVLNQLLLVLNILQISRFYGVTKITDRYFLASSTILFVVNIFSSQIKNLLLPKLLLLRSSYQKYVINYLARLFLVIGVIVLFISLASTLFFSFYPLEAFIISLAMTFNILFLFLSMVLNVQSRIVSVEFVNFIRILSQLAIIQVFVIFKRQDLIMWSLLIPTMLSCVILSTKVSLNLSGRRPELFNRSLLKTSSFLFLVLLITNSQVLIINFAMANFGTGSVSLFNFANKVATIPTVLFGTSFYTLILVKFSGNRSRDSSYDSLSFKGILFDIYAVLFIGVGLVYLNLDLVSKVVVPSLSDTDLLLFNQHSRILLVSSSYLILYSIMLRSFYSRGEIRKPIYLSLYGFVVFLVFIFFGRDLNNSVYSVSFAVLLSGFFLFTASYILLYGFKFGQVLFFLILYCLPIVLLCFDIFINSGTSELSMKHKYLELFIFVILALLIFYRRYLNIFNKVIKIND